MNRRLKIENKFENMFYGNGGHWLDLKLKNGKVLNIQRLNKAQFEKLHWEDFRVNDEIMTYEELITYFENIK